MEHEGTNDIPNPDDILPDITLPEDTGSVLSRRNTVQFEEPFDYKPLKKGALTRFKEMIFRALTKKKTITPIRPPVQMTGNAAKPLGKPSPAPIHPPPPKMTPGMAMEKTILGKMPHAPKSVDVNAIIRSGVTDVPDAPEPPISITVTQPDSAVSSTPSVPPLPINVPSVPVPAKKRRFAIAASSINKLNVLINGMALLIFTAGAYILYSELPTRPELIAGIVLVACASGVLAGRV